MNLICKTFLLTNISKSYKTEKHTANKTSNVQKYNKNNNYIFKINNQSWEKAKIKITIKKKLKSTIRSNKARIGLSDFNLHL